MADATSSQAQYGKASVTSGQQTAPWYTQFPAPKSSPGTISASDLLQLIRASKNEAKPSYVLVDVRRNDHEGGTIATSINLPAQSMFHSLYTLATLIKATGSVGTVIFYCGSSNGRGPRCAAWFQDCLNENAINEFKACILDGGIKGWVKQGRLANAEMLDMVQGYEAQYWDQFMSTQ